MTMRLVRLNQTAKTYDGPWVFQASQPGLVEESEAIRQGYTQAQPSLIVPESVEPWKLRAALGRRGLVEQIDAFIAAQPEPPRIRLLAAWEYVATPIPRRSHFVAAVTAGLGLTEGTVDAIFTEAGNIQDA